MLTTLPGFECRGYQWHMVALIILLGC